MKGGRLRVVNESRYPDEEVRRLVEFGMSEIDLRGTGVTVLVKNTKRRKKRRDGRGVVHQHGYVSFGGEFHDFRRGIPVGLTKKMARKDSYLCVVRVGPPENFPHAKSFRWHDEGFRSWQEALVGITAHEGLHAQHEYDGGYQERATVKRTYKLGRGKTQTVEEKRRIGSQRIEPKAEAFELGILLRYRKHHGYIREGVELPTPARNKQMKGGEPMARVTVQTDNGTEVWSMDGVDAYMLNSLQATTNTRGSALAAGIRRAVQDAERIQRGEDPERPSEKAIRLMHKERDRVADPSYTPTVEEALRNPAAFVEGMTEE